MTDKVAPAQSGRATTVHLNDRLNGAPPDSAAVHAGSGTLTATGDATSSTGHSQRSDDLLSWPLPAHVIVHGRYRVEALLEAGDDTNTYRVTDLRGYERCWACNNYFGAEAANDRFCRICGADLLAGDLFMRDRRLPPEELPQAEAAAANSAQLDPETTEFATPRLFVQGGRAFRVEPRVARAVAFQRGVRLLVGAATDLGLTRGGGEKNEDSALVLVLNRFHENLALPCGLFAVADGMGGHWEGQKASRIAINVLAHTVLRQTMLPALGAPTTRPRDDEQLASMLRDAMRAANNALCAANKENGVDSGCTAVAVLIAGETAHIANVGDSRCYVLDTAGLRRVSVDHSLVQQLVASGMIDAADVYTHPQRNQIFRSFGDDPDLPIDLFAQQLQPGMRLLLCCDGVWEMVRDDQIERILREAPDPQTACDQLVEAANRGGGEDNITALVIEAR